MSSFSVTATPHVRSKDTVQSVMRDVLIALAPAAVMGIVFFGMRALAIMVISVVSAMFFEFLFQKGMKRAVTVSDLSAAVTGLLLAMNMPVSAPLWMPIVGSAFAIVIAKQFFGGLGKNFINPALAGRAFLLASYPTEMTTWVTPGADAISSATPLASLKAGELIPTSADTMQAFLGQIGGCIGETCVIALLIGFAYLLIRKVISWRIPVVYVATVFILFAIIGRPQGRFPVYEIFTGGLMLGAIFMATDYVSSPISAKGQIIYAIGCGALTFLIRRFGGYPEGVSYSILIMNLTVPLIDRGMKTKIFGALPKEKKAKEAKQA